MKKIIAGILALVLVLVMAMAAVSAEEAAPAANEYKMSIDLGGNPYDCILTLDDDTNATLSAAMTFPCTSVKDGDVVTLTPAEEFVDMKATVWSVVPHAFKVAADGTMEAYVEEAAAAEEAPAEEAAAAPAAESVAEFAGEYDVMLTNAEGAEMYFEEFIIDEDGTVHGAVDASGLTSFEGTVDLAGAISGEFPRLGGTITGTVDTAGNVSVHCEVRGRTSDATGTRFE